jgi:hypothetical protein
MTPSELTSRVTVATSVAAVVLALSAAWLVGGPAGGGIVAGAGVAVLNFRWLTAHAVRAVRRSGGGAWVVAAGLRFLVMLVLVGTLLATGLVHPVALLAGLTLLPCTVIVHGLRPGGGS